MSHFSVLVATPIGAPIAPALQPYHEFECTGEADEYVVSVDRLDELLTDYKKDGDDYDDFGSYILDGWGFRPVTGDDAPDLEDEHKYGYYRATEEGRVTEVFHRTNPNKKWDWWSVGGRYSGRLRIVDATCEHNLIADRNGYDAALKSNVDWYGMKKEKTTQRKQWVESCLDAAEGMTRDEALEAFYAAEAYLLEADERTKEWTKTRDESGLSFRDYLLDVYDEAHPVAVAVRSGLWFNTSLLNGNALRFGGMFNQGMLPTYEPVTDIEAWVASAPPLTAFAMVVDGVWYESGEMGWWGMVSGDKKPDEWEAEFNDRLQQIPDDYLLTIVDCHI